MMRLRRQLRAAIVIAAAMFAGGCGNDDEQPAGGGQDAEATVSSADTPSSVPPRTTTSNDTSRSSRGVTRQQAISIARRKYPGERVGDVERDDGDGQAIWKVKLRTAGGAEREVSVARARGDIVKTETDRDDQDDRDDND